MNIRLITIWPGIFISGFFNLIYNQKLNFMFGYFGSKSKLIRSYPIPKYNTIIEPFAGSARYSLMYYKCQVILIDKYKVVTDIWLWLQKCSEKDILNLPVLNTGEELNSIINLSEVEKNFLGFFTQSGQATPANKVSKMRNKEIIKNQLIRCAKQLHKIRHWKIINGSYEDQENIYATWFIDPPYQFGGEHQYKFNNKQINFENLSKWCKSRNGQIIVCENLKANWLPFTPLKLNPGANFTNTFEAIWTNQPDRDNKIYKPLPLF